MAALSTVFAAPAPDAAAAQERIARIDADLVSAAASTPTYGIFDATIILLREGLEALLVIAALLAFLARSGNADKQKWIWAGSAAGIAVSGAVAIAV
ncbi:MAG: FTR1 family protein, partial [Chloroflexi bacterium]|nr:FTR1 family protein [Chloroflexota bacterium]